MKQILLAFALMAITLISKSQTTMDEYKYCIAGYKDVLTKGNDPKVGYTMTEVYEQTLYFGTEHTTVWVRKLVKKATKKIVAYMLIYQLRDKSNDQSYYCVPHPDSDSDIIYKFREDIGWINTPDANSVYKLRSILCAIVDNVKW